MTNPMTIHEWKAYIDSLSGSVLRSKALAANTIDFVHQLQADGIPGKEIAAILVLFARRFEADGQMPPVGMPGQYLSYADLLDHLRSNP